MPRYFLHIEIAGGRVEDPEGVELPNIEAALAETVRVAREFLSEGLLDRELTAQDHLEITNDTDDLLATVPLTRELASGDLDLLRATGFGHRWLDFSAFPPKTGKLPH